MCTWAVSFREELHYVRELGHHSGTTCLAACDGCAGLHSFACRDDQQADPMKGLSSIRCSLYEGITLGLSLGHRDAPQQEEYCDEDVEQAAGD